MGQNLFFSLSDPSKLLSLKADSTSVTFSLGGSRDEASGVWSFEDGISTESSGSSSLASREFVAVSWGITAFSVDFLELTSEVATCGEASVALFSGFFDSVTAHWWDGV